MIATRRWCTALLMISAACAASPPTTGASSRVSKNPNVISHAELVDPVIQSMDALKAIRYLRPSFFRSSGQESSTEAGSVSFSFDYGPVQPINQLAALNTLLLYEVRYLDINAAALRFGLVANGRPVIVLVSDKLAQ